MNYDFELMKSRASRGLDISVSLNFLCDLERDIEIQKNEFKKEIKESFRRNKDEVICSLSVLSDTMDECVTKLQNCSSKLLDLSKSMRKSNAKSEIEEIRTYIDTYIINMIECEFNRTLDNAIECISHEK
jgi:hypothetical protein